MDAAEVTRIDAERWNDPGEAESFADEVGALTAAAAEADGVSPLSEAFLLRLWHPGPGTRHFVARADHTLLGYAQLHTTGREAELVVHPASRHRGTGRRLLTALLDTTETAAGHTGDGPLHIWAHGDHPSATALLLPAGFERSRVLWQLRRDLRGTVPVPDPPAGVRLRPFRPGVDDEPWLRLNARAFADHPDQGRWRVDDLRLRQAEPWFDPAGFLIAEDETGRMLGFHWTKVHDRPAPVGEVYVLGVDPDAQGTGLGATLTAAGLRHLQERGLRQVLLYVDEDNPRAVALYRRLGFAQWVTDVAFRRLAG